MRKLLLLLLYIPFLGFTQEIVSSNNITQEIVRFGDAKGDYYYEYYYNGNLFTGTSIDYYKNGQLDKKVNYKNGLKDGLWQNWLGNGQLGEEGNYKNGLEDGLYRRWYENGQLKNYINYKNGEPHGLRKKWHENGQLWLVENYIDGEQISGKRFDKEGNEKHIPVASELDK